MKIIIRTNSILIILGLAALFGNSCVSNHDLPPEELARWDAGNLKVLSAGLLSYAWEGHPAGAEPGGLPDDLMTLVEHNEVPLSRVYTSPFLHDKNRVPDLAELRGETADYVYLGRGVSVRHALGDKLVIMHTRLRKRGQYVNFLFLDGHVEGKANVLNVEETVKQCGWLLPKQ